MSDHAFGFLQSWIAENVNATMYGNENTVEHLAHDCVWEAETRGISNADLTEAAGGDPERLHALRAEPRTYPRT
jgi:hypothetical protein